MARVIDYTPVTAPSEWAKDAADLKELPAGKAIVIEGKRSARTAFQRAARDAGFTARCVNTEIVTASEDTNDKGEKVDTSDYEFTFVRAELRTRKAKDADADADADEVADSE